MTKGFPNDAWTRVTIFLKAHGRLPTNDYDKITNQTLLLFCKNYNGEPDLKPIYNAIREVVPTDALLMPSEVIEPIIRFVKDVKQYGKRI